MKRNRRIGSAQISEFSATFALFFLAMLLPIVALVSISTAVATGYFTARYCAARAGDSTSFVQALSAAEAAAHEINSSGWAKFAGLKPVRGYNNSGMDLWLTDTNIATNVNITHGPNTPAVSAIDQEKYLYSYDAIVTYDVGPFLNLSGLPFVGNVEGLGKPVRMSFEASRTVEHLDGLTASGGGFTVTGPIISMVGGSSMSGNSSGSASSSSGSYYSSSSSGSSGNFASTGASSNGYQAAILPRRPWQVASTNGVTRNIPNVTSSFHVQLQGEVDYSLPVDVMETDLYSTTAANVAQLHANGAYAIAYLNTGAWQPDMPDSDSYPASVIGTEPMKGWKEERWLDIRQIEVLRPIIQQKMQLAKDKGFDAVDPDNMDGYTNTREFQLTKAHQVAFNQMVAEEAHKLGLAVMLKNGGDMMDELVDHFDGTVAEQAYKYNESEIYQPMRDANKPVFLIEYNKPKKSQLQDAIDRGFNVVKAKLALKGKTKMLTPN
ncbi:MAG: endo alpha-1,4 polygalactosaminidase [Candidatus Melainabacteria bacterium]|nr:endo alpha-1,4 polygalactosaminidase [Candidatus Melainabacteria bacterium]